MGDKNNQGQLVKKKTGGDLSASIAKSNPNSQLASKQKPKGANAVATSERGIKRNESQHQEDALVSKFQDGYDTQAIVDLKKQNQVKLSLINQGQLTLGNANQGKPQASSGGGSNFNTESTDDQFKEKFERVMKYQTKNPLTQAVMVHAEQTQLTKPPGQTIVQKPQTKKGSHPIVVIQRGTSQSNEEVVNRGDDTNMLSPPKQNEDITLANFQERVRIQPVATSVEGNKFLLGLQGQNRGGKLNSYVPVDDIEFDQDEYVPEQRSSNAFVQKPSKQSQPVSSRLVQSKLPNAPVKQPSKSQTAAMASTEPKKKPAEEGDVQTCFLTDAEYKLFLKNEKELNPPKGWVNPFKLNIQELGTFKHFQRGIDIQIHHVFTVPSLKSPIVVATYRLTQKKGEQLERFCIEAPYSQLIYFLKMPVKYEELVYKTAERQLKIDKQIPKIQTIDDPPTQLTNYDEADHLVKLEKVQMFHNLWKRWLNNPLNLKALMNFHSKILKLGGTFLDKRERPIDDNGNPRDHSSGRPHNGFSEQAQGCKDFLSQKLRMRQDISRQNQRRSRSNDQQKDEEELPAIEKDSYFSYVLKYDEKEDAESLQNARDAYKQRMNDKLVQLWQIYGMGTLIQNMGNLQKVSGPILRLEGIDGTNRIHRDRYCAFPCKIKRRVLTPDGFDPDDDLTQEQAQMYAMMLEQFMLAYYYGSMKEAKQSTNLMKRYPALSKHTNDELADDFRRTAHLYYGQNPKLTQVEDVMISFERVAIALEFSGLTKRERAQQSTVIRQLASVMGEEEAQKQVEKSANVQQDKDLGEGSKKQKQLTAYTISDPLRALGIMFNQLFDYEVFQDKAIVFQCACIMAGIPADKYLETMSKEYINLTKLFAIDNSGNIHRFEQVLVQQLYRHDRSEGNEDNQDEGAKVKGRQLKDMNPYPGWHVFHIIEKLYFLEKRGPYIIQLDRYNSSKSQKISEFAVVKFEKSIAKGCLIFNSAGMHIEYFQHYNDHSEFPFDSVFYYLGSDHSNRIQKAAGQGSDRTKSHYHSVTIYRLQQDNKPDELSRLKRTAIMNFLQEMSWRKVKPDNLQDGILNMYLNTKSISIGHSERIGYFKFLESMQFCAKYPGLMRRSIVSLPQYIFGQEAVVSLTNSRRLNHMMTLVSQWLLDCSLLDTIKGGINMLDGGFPGLLQLHYTVESRLQQAKNVLSKMELPDPTKTITESKRVTELEKIRVFQDRPLIADEIRTCFGLRAITVALIRYMLLKNKNYRKLQEDIDRSYNLSFNAYDIKKSSVEYFMTCYSQRYTIFLQKQSLSYYRQIDSRYSLEEKSSEFASGMKQYTRDNETPDDELQQFMAQVHVFKTNKEKTEEVVAAFMLGLVATDAGIMNIIRWLSSNYDDRREISFGSVSTKDIVSKYTSECKLMGNGGHIPNPGYEVRCILYNRKGELIQELIDGKWEHREVKLNKHQRWDLWTISHIAAMPFHVIGSPPPSNLLTRHLEDEGYFEVYYVAGGEIEVLTQMESRHQVLSQVYHDHTQATLKMKTESYQEQEDEEEKEELEAYLQHDKALEKLTKANKNYSGIHERLAPTDDKLARDLDEPMEMDSSSKMPEGAIADPLGEQEVVIISTSIKPAQPKPQQTTALSSSTNMRAPNLWEVMEELDRQLDQTEQMKTNSYRYFQIRDTGQTISQGKGKAVQLRYYLPVHNNQDDDDDMDEPGQLYDEHEMRDSQMADVQQPVDEQEVVDRPTNERAGNQVEKVEDGEEKLVGEGEDQQMVEVPDNQDDEDEDQQPADEEEEDDDDEPMDGNQVDEEVGNQDDEEEDQQLAGEEEEDGEEIHPPKKQVPTFRNRQDNDPSLESTPPSSKHQKRSNQLPKVSQNSKDIAKKKAKKHVRYEGGSQRGRKSAQPKEAMKPILKGESKSMKK